MLVETILRAKGDALVTIDPDEPVRMAAHLMATRRLGCLVVTRDGSHLDGLITERDLVRALAVRGPEASTTRVRVIMSRDVPVCAPSDHVASLMRTMTDRRYRHVPVVRDSVLVGLVSIGDVVKCRLDDMELETSVLRDVHTSAH